MQIHMMIAMIAWVPVSGFTQEQESDRKTIEINIHPKSLTEQSYGLKLLPEQNELREGNAAVVYLRMVYERNNYMEQVVPKFESWLDAPFDNQEMINGLRFEHFYGQIKRAAFMRDADWNHPIGEESQVWIALPELATGRNFIGWGLSLYMRQQLAKKNPEVAHEALLVGLASARHYARTPFLVCNFVGSACATGLLEQADLLVQQSDYENLFWAYQKLPQPLFDLQKSISLEKNAIEQSIPELKQRPWPDHDENGKWLQIGSQIATMFQLKNVSPLDTAAKLQKLFTYLKANWNQIGDETRDDVDQMSGEELAVRFFIIKSRYFMERTQAAFSLPPSEAIKMLEKNTMAIDELADEIGVSDIKELFEDYSFAYYNLWRPSRKIIALQTIEAIRHYAGNHDGKLPDSLDAIDSIPVPSDPFTAKPMEYKLGDGSATLIMVNPSRLSRLESIERFEYKYRIRVVR